MTADMTILPAPGGGSTSATPDSGGRPGFPLSTDTTRALREYAAGLRWPQKSLTTLALDLSDREREVHVATCRGDEPAAAAAEAKRRAAWGALDEEREHVADVFLAVLSHAIEYKPDETVDLFARVLADPRIKTALVPILSALLAPTVDWLRGEQRELADRVTDLEAVAAGEAVFA